MNFKFQRFKELILNYFVNKRVSVKQLWHPSNFGNFESGFSNPKKLLYIPIWKTLKYTCYQDERHFSPLVMINEESSAPWYSYIHTLSKHLLKVQNKQNRFQSEHNNILITVQNTHRNTFSNYMYIVFNIFVFYI